MTETSKSTTSHFWSLLKELFNNSLPVFVAATISRAMTSSIALLSEDLDLLIWVTFSYAFFLAQAIGITVAIRMDRSNISFNYFMNVCSECTGFAWKEFVTMIMLKWLFVNRDIGYAVGAWLLVVLGAFGGVYIFNAVLALYYKPAADIYNALRKFNSDAFALAIAFSFTLVIASELYPASSNMAGADDIVLNPDDALEDTNGGWYFVGYAFFITCFVALLQWKFGWVVTKEDSEEAALQDNRMSFSGETPYDTPQRLTKRDEQYWKSIDSVDEDSSELLSTVTPSSMNPMNQGGLLRESSSKKNLPVIRPTHSTTDSQSVFSACNSCWSYFDNIVFAWDPKGRCRQSLMHLINTVSGYIVGCAWYTFSVLTFQESFKNIRGGEILGLFIYSLFMTLTVALIMGKVERRTEKNLKAKLKDFGKDSSITHDVVAKFTARYKRGNELALVAGRLICGWSWSDFITSVFTSVLSDREREFTQFKSSNWLSAIIKCVVAVLILWTGKCVDEHFTRKRLRKLGGGGMTDAEEKIYSNPGSPASSFHTARDQDDQESKRNTERIFQAVINGKEVFRMPSAAGKNSSNNSQAGSVSGRNSDADSLKVSLLGNDESDEEDVVVI